MMTIPMVGVLGGVSRRPLYLTTLHRGELVVINVKRQILVL